MEGSGTEFGVEWLQYSMTNADGRNKVIEAQSREGTRNAEEDNLSVNRV